METGSIDSMTVVMATAGLLLVVLILLLCVAMRHQRKLRLRAWLMNEAVRNRDFTFRLPVRGLLSGERAMQETLNSFGGEIGQLMAVNEVQSWERLTRVLTHEIMNALTPINSISQAYLSDPAIKGSAYEDGLLAIQRTGASLSAFVDSYRKLAQLQKPQMQTVQLADFVASVVPLYPDVRWSVDIPATVGVKADAGMMRQVLLNIIKNAIEAGATDMELRWAGSTGTALQRDRLLVSNDGAMVPADVRREMFIPFFTTKSGGSGIGLSLSRQMMVVQGGNIVLAERPVAGYNTTFEIIF